MLPSESLFPVHVTPRQLEKIVECICGHFGMDGIAFRVVCSGSTGILQIDLAVEFAGRTHDCCVLVPNPWARPRMREGFHAMHMVRRVLHGENRFIASVGSQPRSNIRPAYGS